MLEMFYERSMGRIDLKKTTLKIERPGGTVLEKRLIALGPF
jgi:uncharacterized protein with von Willebrand factor type A (vWA) domain